MIDLTIPGRGPLRISHLVMDVNGTLAVDGTLIDGLARRISGLRDRVEIHLVTADTHGRQDDIDFALSSVAVRLKPSEESGQKAEFVRSLGAEKVAAIGQGANDAGMLKAAALGVCVMSVEGVALETLLSADLLVPDIHAALDLFDRPLRIIASLRQ